MSNMVLNRALLYIPVLEQRYQSYLDQCAEDRRNGFRPHYCEHGTNQWVDYDNICQGCEEGWTLADGGYLRRTAIEWAKSDINDARITTLAVLLDNAMLESVDAVREVMSGIKRGDMTPVLDRRRQIEFGWLTHVDRIRWDD